MLPHRRTPKDIPPDAAGVHLPTGAPAWVTPELIELTIHTWQPYYEQPLAADEALQLLLAANGLLRMLTTSQEHD